MEDKELIKMFHSILLKMDILECELQETQKFISTLMLPKDVSEKVFVEIDDYFNKSRENFREECMKLLKGEEE